MTSHTQTRHLTATLHLLYENVTLMQFTRGIICDMLCDIFVVRLQETVTNSFITKMQIDPPCDLHNYDVIMKKFVEHHISYTYSYTSTTYQISEGNIRLTHINECISSHTDIILKRQTITDPQLIST